MKSFFKKYWVFSLLFIAVIVLYTINLDKNSRFIWDESRALVDMHRIWEKKEITFVGPISEDNLEMFPSLSYYMYMPATILTNFDPLGPVYMASFYGIVAWLIATVTFIKILGVNWKSFLLSLLTASIFPVVLASRWAWNPNLVIFWFTIFLSSIFYKNPLILFAGGISLGASLYHHYLAAFGVIPALIFLPMIINNKKEILSKLGVIVSGFFVSTAPFILFELKNHYFFNSGTFLSANDKSFLSISTIGYLGRLENAVTVFSTMFVPNNQFYIWGLLLIFTIIFSIYHQDNLLKYSYLSLLASFLLFGIVRSTNAHYQFCQVPLVLLFLCRYVYLNKNIFGKLLVLALLVFGLQKTFLFINSYTWEGDIVGVRNVLGYVLSEKELHTNIAALASGDQNTRAQRYRDMVLINGKQLDALDKYQDSKVLYVVSWTNDQKVIMEDGAWEISSFKNSKITNIWKVSDYPTYLFRLEKQ